MVATLRCALPALFDPQHISRFVFSCKRFAKLIECSPFDFSAGLIHQIQIKMQVMQRDQAKAKNFFRLDEVSNVATRKFTTGIARAVFFDRIFVQNELGIF